MDSPESSLTAQQQTRRKKLLSYLYVAALGFNLLWLAGSVAVGVFDEKSFLPSNSLRALAYPYYGPSWRESRFVGIVLHELYDGPTLVTSQAVLDYLFEVEEVSYHAREVTVRIVDDPGQYAPAMPVGEEETYIIGLEGREVSFVVPTEGAAGWEYVVAIRDGDRVLFVPAQEIAE